MSQLQQHRYHNHQQLQQQQQQQQQQQRQQQQSEMVHHRHLQQHRSNNKDVSTSFDYPPSTSSSSSPPPFQQQFIPQNAFELMMNSTTVTTTGGKHGRKLQSSSSRFQESTNKEEEETFQYVTSEHNRAPTSSPSSRLQQRNKMQQQQQQQQQQQYPRNSRGNNNSKLSLERQPIITGQQHFSLRQSPSQQPSCPYKSSRTSTTTINTTTHLEQQQQEFPLSFSSSSLGKEKEEEGRRSSTQQRNTLRINPANIPRSLILNEPTVLMEPGILPSSFIHQPAAVATSSSSSSSAVPQQRPIRERRRGRRGSSSRPTAEEVKYRQNSNGSSVDLGDLCFVADNNEGNNNNNEDNLLEESYQLSSCSFPHQVTTLQQQLSSSIILDLSNPDLYHGPGGETAEQQQGTAAENVGKNGGGKHMSQSWSGPFAGVDEDVEDCMHHESRPGAYPVNGSTNGGTVASRRRNTTGAATPSTTSWEGEGRLRQIREDFKERQQQRLAKSGSSGGVDKMTARSKRRSASDCNKSLPNQQQDRRLSSPEYLLKQQQQQMGGGDFRDKNQEKEAHRTVEDKMHESWLRAYPPGRGAANFITTNPEESSEDSSRERPRGQERRPQTDTTERGGGAVPHHYYNRREGEKNPPIIDNSVPAFDEAFRLRPMKQEGNKAEPKKSRYHLGSIAKAILGKPKLQITKDILNAVKNSTTKSNREENIPDATCTFVQ